MGCGLSKIDTELTRLCRERTDLIKASRDSLYSLANAHAEYFRSLESVEHGIRNFVGEALVIHFYSAYDTDRSYQLVEDIPRAKDSFLGSDFAESDGSTLTDYVDEVPHSQSEYSEYNEYDEYDKPSFAERPIGFFNPVPSVYGIPNVFYGKISFRTGNAQSFQSDGFYPGTSSFPQSANGISSQCDNVPQSGSGHFFLSGDFESSLNQRSINSADILTSTDHGDGAREFSIHNCLPDVRFNSIEDLPLNDVMPSQTYNHIGYSSNSVYSNISDWDFVNPFNTVPDGFTSSYLPGIDFVSDNTDFREVRREGIPDLEDEVDDLVREVYLGKEFTESGVVLDDCHIHEQAIKTEVDVHQHVEAEGCDDGQHDLEDRIEYIALQEFSSEIKDASDAIRIHAGGVSELLKQYEPSSTVIKVLELGIFGRQKLKVLNGGLMKCGSETSRTSHSLSLTLQKLYIWEQKLYEEVKGEEKLRQIYDRELLKLKRLDDRGAESFKIDAGQLSLQKLAAGIDVALSKVKEIATRTFTIRDDELHPQLCEFICRLHKLWKFSSESYKKHMQAIVKVHANASISCVLHDSSLKETEKLETVMLKLGTTFSTWVRCHKEFVSSLRKWLMKCQLQQKKDVNVSYSSSSSHSVQTVLDICNIWHDAIEKVSDIDIIQAINNFTSLLRQLRRNLNEERYQRLRFEYLSSNYDRQMKKYCMEKGVNWDQHASLLREADLSHSIQENSPLGTLYAGLRPIRSKFHEARREHEEVVKQLQNITTSGILQNGFVLVLEALDNFNAEMLEAYEQVEIRNEGSTH